MFRLFLFWGFLVPALAALPVVGTMRGYSIPDLANADELLGDFSLAGDSQKTPFQLQIIFENCNELRDFRNNALPLTALKLKYFDAQTSSYKTKDLKLSRRRRNCIHNVEFYEDLQEKYNMELWASFNKQKAIAGTFRGRAYINILPKP